MMLEGNALLNSVVLSHGVYKVFHYRRNALHVSKERNKLHCDKVLLKSATSQHCEAFGNDILSVPWLLRHVILNIIKLTKKYYLNFRVTRFVLSFKSPD